MHEQATQQHTKRDKPRDRAAKIAWETIPAVVLKEPPEVSGVKETRLDLFILGNESISLMEGQWKLSRILLIENKGYRDSLTINDYSSAVIWVHRWSMQTPEYTVRDISLIFVVRHRPEKLMQVLHLGEWEGQKHEIDGVYRLTSDHPKSYLLVVGELPSGPFFDMLKVALCEWRKVDEDLIRKAWTSRSVYHERMLRVAMTAHPQEVVEVGKTIPKKKRRPKADWLLEFDYGVEILEKGIERGIERGMEKGMEKIVQHMLHQEIRLAEIAELTGVPLNRVREIAQANS